MVNHREGFKVVVNQEAQDRIAGDCCPACGTPRILWKRKRGYRCCSKQCTDRFWKEQVLAQGWPDLRMKAIIRDRYTCVKCSLKAKDSSGSGLIADHIIPIALGGPEWDLANIQTLCISCNKLKTADDAAKIAALRRNEKVWAKNKQL